MYMFSFSTWDPRGVERQSLQQSLKKTTRHSSWRMLWIHFPFQGKLFSFPTRCSIAWTFCMQSGSLGKRSKQRIVVPEWELFQTLKSSWDQPTIFHMKTKNYLGPYTSQAATWIKKKFTITSKLTHFKSRSVSFRFCIPTSFVERTAAIFQRHCHVRRNQAVSNTPVMKSTNLWRFQGNIGA